MKSDEAEKVFGDGYNCAQGVFLPFAQEFGLDAETALLTASSFGAGMGRTQETCGAVTGALMAIGLKYGFTKPGDQERRDLVLRKTRELMARFREEFGTLKCKDLLGLDLNTDEGQALHKEKDQREQICMKCVRYAASVVEGL
jgi:C_GCAxxG_C_C family probable redox protein